MKNCLLLIDPQNDYLSDFGSLETPKDVELLISTMESDIKFFDGIAMMLDSHYLMDISHPNYWVDFEGKHPEPGTQITKKEVKGRKYSVYMPDAPRDIFEEKQKMAVEYLDNLESLGKKHTIKPVHCIIGTWGHSIYEPIMKEVLKWSEVKGRDCQVVLKGLYQHAEHFGAFEADVPNPSVPETMLNQGILQYLDNFENVYIWGNKEVLLNTLIQLYDCSIQLNAPDIIDRYVVLSTDQEVLSYAREKDFRIKE